MKKYIVSALILAASIMGIVGQASAATNAPPNGLLQGVSGTSMKTGSAVGVAGGNIGTSTTDGDDATGYQMSASGGATDTVWYQFSTPQTITSAYVKIQYSGSLRLYNSSKVELLSWGTSSGTIDVTDTSNVVFVAVDHGDALVNTLYTFELYGLAPVDSTSPTVPTGVTATASGETTVNLSWTASTDAGGMKGYNVYRGATKLTPVPQVGTTYSDTGLTPSTLYSYQIEAVDNADNLSAKSTAVSATTATPPPPPDTTAPGIPAITGTAGATFSDLSWAAVSAPDLQGYHVYRDGVKKTTTPITITSYHDGGLVDGQSYIYTVTSIDATGNESSPSNALTLTPSTVMTAALSPNGTSIVVTITKGKAPFTIDWGSGSATASARTYYISGLTKSTSYTVTVTDADGKTATATVNTGALISPLPPIMPDSTSLFQKMVNSFSTAGTIALAVIGGAIALGVLIFLALWGWRLTKRWLATSK